MDPVVGLTADLNVGLSCRLLIAFIFIYSYRFTTSVVASSSPASRFRCRLVSLSTWLSATFPHRMSCSNSCLLSLLSNCPVWKLLQCVTVIMKKKTKTSAKVSISWQRVMSIRAWGCRDTCDICRLCQGCTCWCWRSGRCPEVTAT